MLTLRAYRQPAATTLLAVMATGGWLLTRRDNAAAAMHTITSTVTRGTVQQDVSAEDVTSVKSGMQAQVTPTGASQPVYGTVSEVGLVASADSSGAATFPITIAVTGPQSGLYAGTSATVAIITRQLTNVLTVPTAALHTSGSSTYVEKQSGSSTVRQAGPRAPGRTVASAARAHPAAGSAGRREGRGEPGAALVAAVSSEPEEPVRDADEVDPASSGPWEIRRWTSRPRPSAALS